MMFTNLRDKLNTSFKRLRGRTVISQADLDATLKDVRMSLLEADVNFKVAKQLCESIAEKAKGQEVLTKSLSPDQEIIRLIHEEMKEVLGGDAVELNLKVAPPAVILLVGLQGSGKTTTAGKLALYLRKELKRSPLLVPADVYRLAAIEQLTTLGRNLGVPVYPSQKTDNPVHIARDAIQEAKNKGYDTVIIDTAGRLQIDQQLMDELKQVQVTVQPHEILLVVDAMTGQVAADVAKSFDTAIGLTGLILTKLDGDARGGAALSMRTVTGKPIKFMGIGEKSDALEVFHPERLASRILGMGDVLSLIEKAQKEISVDEAMDLGKKLQKNEFTLEDFLTQMKMMKRMGSITSLLGMIPGMDAMAKKIDPAQAEKEMKKVEAIILSMTRKERRNVGILDASRRRRIAKGSGTSVEAVNKLTRDFLEMKKMMAKMSKMGLGGMMKGMKGGLGGMKGF